MSYKPKRGDVVCVTGCISKTHNGMCGTYLHTDFTGAMHVRFEDGKQCATKAVVSLPPASEVFARAEQQCAEWRADAATYDQIMGKLLDLMATVHGMRNAAREREQSDKKGQNNG